MLDTSLADFMDFLLPLTFSPQHKAIPLSCSIFLCNCHHPPPFPNFISFFIAIEQVTLGAMRAVEKVMAA
jgi:hypothetical protein